MDRDTDEESQELQVTLSQPLLAAEEAAGPLRAVTRSFVIHPQDGPGTSLKGTVLNISNIYIGIAVLSMHYAVHQGGWLSLLCLAGAAALFCFSAHLMVSAFDLLPYGTPRTYPELGQAAYGRAGTRVVLVAAFIELAGSSCLLLLVMWRLMELFLPSEGLLGLSTLHDAVALSALFIVPALLLPLHKLTWLSAIGSSASVLVAAVVVSLVFVDPNRSGVHQPPAGHSLARLGMLQSVGIFCLSVSGHSTLPALRAAMASPQQFPAALRLSFGVLTLVYSAVAATGYWYFGDAASPLITTDLAMNSIYAGSVDRLLSALVAINALCKYPTLLMCLQDMLLSRFVPPTRSSASKTVTYGMRLLLYVATAGLSLAAYNILGQAMSLLGGWASLTCSLLMPTAFYLRMTWPEQSALRRAGFLSLLAGGTLLVCFITAQNVLDILHPERQEQHSQGQGAAGEALMATGRLLHGS